MCHVRWVSYAKAEYVCLSSTAESGGSPNNENGALMYMVENEAPVPQNSLLYYEPTCAICATAGYVPPPPPPPPAPAPSGPTFTRWGRRDCPSTATLVYEGVVGGSHFQHPGTGFEALCMTLAPEYTPAGYSQANSVAGIVYSAEYHTQSFGLGAAFDLLHNRGIPCAVCARKLQQSKHAMIPGPPCPRGRKKNKKKKKKKEMNVGMNE